MKFINIEYIFYKIYNFFLCVYEFIVSFDINTDLEGIPGRVKIISALISVLFLIGIFYSLKKVAELKKEELAEYIKAIVEETPEDRLLKWEKIKKHMDSENSSDWRMAILEADSLLDDIIEKIGYEGKTFGDRLTHISSAQFRSLDDVWYAHKIRNKIAHEGADYEITKDAMEKIMEIYKKAFEELEYL